MPRQRRKFDEVETQPLAIPQPEDLPAEPDDEDDAEPERRGPGGQPFKLTSAQRRLLLELIAKYEHTNIVRDELKDIDPEFPELTDQAIRYYRGQMRRGKYPWVNEYLKNYVQQGLGNVDRRIALLSRQYQKLSKIPLVEETQIATQSGQIVTAYIGRPEISREMREILNAIDRMQNPPARGFAAQSATTTMQQRDQSIQTEDDPDVVNDQATESDIEELTELLATLQTSQADVQEALALAQRPRSNENPS